MLGDIVSNNTNQGGATATAKRPTQPQAAGGYGSSNFGDPKPASAPTQTSRPMQPRPTVAAQAAPVRPLQAQAAAAPVASRPVATPVSLTPAKKSSKVPLILTIVGVVVFIGGVAALFIYALGGK